MGKETHHVLVDGVDDGDDAVGCGDVPLHVVVAGQHLQKLQALIHDFAFLKEKCSWCQEKIRLER